MTPLQVLSLFLTADIAKALNVTAYAGGAVYFKCGYRMDQCEQQDPNCFFNKTRSQMHGNDRFLIRGNGKGYLEIGLGRLTTHETGQYRCLVGTAGGPPSPINLEVIKDACCGKDVQLEKSEGENFNISCPYLQTHAQTPKFFCKRGSGHECFYKQTVQSDRTWKHIHHHSLYDDREAGVLVVAISRFNRYKEGSYWCGAEVTWDTNGYKVLFHHTELTVRGQQTSTPTTTPQSASTPPPPPSPSTSSSVLVKDLFKTCKGSDVECKLDFLSKLEWNSLQSNDVSRLLDALLEAPPESVALRGEVLLASERLLARLVEPTRTQSNREFSTNSIEVRILNIGQNTNLTEVPLLKTADVHLDIDLLEIAKNNNGSASVLLVVYNSMMEVLNGNFFETAPSETADVASKVFSVLLYNTVDETLQTPIYLTMTHLKLTSRKERPICVYWNVSAWIRDGCYVSFTNSTHTICTCKHLSTFALIMTIDHNLERHSWVDVLNTIFVLIGLVFLMLAVMTFALCRWNPRVSNVARLNLCVCLLLAQPLFLLTQSFIHLIRTHQVLCKVLSGLLHFLFLCCFVWMSIEAVLLFLSVRKLKQVKPSERLRLHWKLNLLIGYGFPLIIVAVSAAVKPEGYGSDGCWLSKENGFFWSFLGPVCFFLVVNITLFFVILITIYSTLKTARNEVSKVKYNRVLLFKITVQFVILGCPWILGLFAAYSWVLKVLFLFLTSQQGTAIFLIHCLLNMEVRRQYRTWWQRFGPSTKRTDQNRGPGISLSQQTTGATLTTSQSALPLRSITPASSKASEACWEKQ